MRFKVRDPVVNMNTGWQGRVIEINEKYGWFKVQWDNGKIKMYNGHEGSRRSVSFDYTKPRIR